jgi:transcriptional regulator with XRE-family HTH domain
MASYFLSLTGMLKSLGERAQRLRLLRNLTQQELAKQAGVGIKALRRFESTGHGAVENVLRVAVALGVPDAFGALFEVPAFNSLAEIEASAAIIHRRRARKRR